MALKQEVEDAPLTQDGLTIDIDISICQPALQV
jgi:hypothetical protein